MSQGIVPDRPGWDCISQSSHAPTSTYPALRLTMCGVPGTIFPMRTLLFLVIGISCLAAYSVCAQAPLDMHRYQPVEDLHNKVYEFTDRTGGQSAVFYEMYRVYRENGKVLLELERYIGDGELYLRGLLESREQGLLWVRSSHRAKGPKAMIEEVPWTLTEPLVMPWRVEQGHVLSRKYSFRQFYNDKYGYVTYLFDLKLVPEGVSQLTLNGRTYECAVISASGTMSSWLDSGYTYPPSGIGYTYYYALDLGLVRTEVTSDGRTSDISLKRIMSIEEFEKIKRR